MTTNHKPGHRPRDIILNRYCPELSFKDREIARERLQGLASILVKIAMRTVAEEWEQKGLKAPAGIKFD